MEPIVQTLRAHLEARDLGAFLTSYEAGAAGSGSIEMTTVTQRVLPGVLLEQFGAGRVTDGQTVHLWRLVRSGRLVLVDDVLLEAINARLDSAWLAAYGPDATLPEKLLTFGPDTKKRAARLPAAPQVDTGALPMQRIVVSSVFSIGATRQTDGLAFKKNVCLSNQEREFLKAVRQYFPSYWAYPNVPLKNFIDVDGFICSLSDRHRSYSRAAQVDVLLCTDDEDPVAAFELDSVHHDAEEATERDSLKEDLFRLSGIALFRIRPDDTRNVRAEDFYDLLCAQDAELDKVRPRRLRPRRTHDMLVPASTRVARSSEADVMVHSK